MSKQVFISHRNNDHSNEAGEQVGTHLQEQGHTIFFDKFNLEGGMDWDQTIIDNLLTSDVVIVILDKETVESDWVQREIDMARANHISLLPVTLHDAFEEIAPALERFDLEKKQFIHFPRTTSIQKITDVITNIGNQIERLSDETLERQKVAYKAWQERHKITPRIRQHSAYASYHLSRHSDRCEFVLASGDATQISGFDVLINTENDYLQMARFFEMNTLSALIRWRGAEFSPGKSLKRDTVQEQINAQLRQMGIHELPVGEGFVLPTFAGNEGSQLRQVGFTYIFHAATVKINRTSRQINSLNVKANPEIVQNCLDLAQEVYDRDGAILYENGQVMASASDKKDIESVLFPVFGAGNGGNPLVEATQKIIEGFRNYYERHADHPIKRVGLCIYNFNDMEQVQTLFEQAGFKQVT
ncbi:MAG: TIR domain-containing protein [Anaerolineae bacterium]